MRNFLTIVPALSLVIAACGGGPEAYREPPVLKVTSPARSLVQSSAGNIQVKGTVTPNIDGTPVDKVLVNNVAANVAADGTWQATVEISEGASFIETVATDREGGKAFDTRAVHAGEIRTAGSNIDNAVTAAMSTEAFAKISAAAGPMVKGLDLGAMIAPMQPMQHAGDPGGEDCLFERVFVNDVKFSDIKISLIPQQGGIAFRAQIDGLDIPGYARYAVACVNGQTNLRVTADRVVVSGTLLVSPNGMQGFSTDLVDQNVELTNFHLDASGIPGTIVDMIDAIGLVKTAVGKGTELAMEPMMNSALGALAGPKELNLLGKTMTMEVSPSDISFDPSGALVTMNMSMLIAGAENAKYIYTANGAPTMDPGNGFQLGLADDLANEMMSEAHAIGLLNLSMPASGGTFDSTDIEMTLPPMISADPTDGSMKVVLGDMIATYKSKGTPVAKAAINAKIDLQIETAGNGYAVALKLGTPVIKFTVLDDIANVTRLEDADLAAASGACLNAQISNIAALLVNIPLPSVAGLQMRNLSVGSDDGYVMVKGSFE
ncbi:MAG: hypothetical protein ABI867_14835 [Kofleriaceae bacterium]